MTKPPVANEGDAVATIKSIVGGEVMRARIGVGTFVTLDVREPPPRSGELRLWIYFANWALLEGETEIIASDMSDADFDANRGAIERLQGAMVKWARFFEDNEVHLGFTGHRALEIWPYEAPEDDAPMIMIFRDGSHLANLERREPPAQAPESD